MADLVERLRKEYDAIGAAIHADAADEIERLRGMVDEIQAARIYLRDQNRLLTELAEVKEDRDEWRVLADEHLAKLVDCKKERDAFQDQCIRLKNERAVEREQLAAVTKDLETERCLSMHPAPAVPTGWTLVPNEPTDEMRVAALLELEGEKSTVAIYKAMIAAAPKMETAVPEDCYINCPNCGELAGTNESRINKQLVKYREALEMARDAIENGPRWNDGEQAYNKIDEVLK